MNVNISRMLALLVLMSSTADSRAEVRIVRVPYHGEVPEVVLDGNGVLHLTYGREAPGNAYYVQSHDGGRTFTPPVQLNRRPDTVTTGRERGPRLAVGKDGIVHVIWLGYYKKGGGVWYTRSIDGGKTFQPERNLLDTQTGSDNATVAADRQGNVFVLWTDGRLGPDPNSPTAAPIFMARSADSGATFSKNEPVHHDYPGQACGCCRLEAQVGENGNLYIAFRGGYHSIRDPFLLKGCKTDNNFKVVRVSADDWKFG